MIKSVYGLTLKMLLLVSTWLVVTSCEEKHMVSQHTDQQAYTYLALGDSYTIGEGVEETERWPNQLGDLLSNDGINLEEVRIIAQTGWTTANLQAAIEMNDIGDYDMVSLLIGVNNQYQGLPFEEFKVEFDELLNQALTFAVDNNVFVVSIPDYGVTPFGMSNAEQIAEELDMYNQYMAGKSEELGLPFINITEISRELGSSENALAPDGLHPSGFQYEQWANEILPSAKALLTE